MYGLGVSLNWMEWIATSSFSFLEGTSDPDDLIVSAQNLGHHGLGLADRMGIYGWVRAYRVVRETGMFYAPGIRLHFDHAEPLAIYPLHKGAHALLMEYLSAWALAGSSHGEKGLGPLAWQDFFLFLQTHAATLARDFVLIWLPGRFYPWPAPRVVGEEPRYHAQEILRIGPSFSFDPLQGNALPYALVQLAALCGRGSASPLSIAYPLLWGPGLDPLRQWLSATARRLDVPLLATTLPLFAEESDHAFADLVTSVRFRKNIEQLGYLAQPNGERSLLTVVRCRFWQRMIKEQRLPNCPFARSLELKGRHHFSLGDLRYTYPREAVPSGESPTTYLRKLAEEGLVNRYPQGAPDSIKNQVDKELELVAELGYEDYFLTIWDILRYARDQKILFQGRGSAASSALCYVLGVTAVDPASFELLFERFLSKERNEPPDIDVDFEHERREEVFREVYQRYGRERAAMVNTVIRFRGRMAFRETATAFGLNKESVDRYIPFLSLGILRGQPMAEAHQQALSALWAADRMTPLRWQKICELAGRLKGRPRHVGIHTGGFVLGNERLSAQCILEPARMAGRSVIPWNKDDIDTLKWMKVDLLSLGMLTVIRKALAHLATPLCLKPAQAMALHQVPREDLKVYQDICAADTVGVFQIESRAQMSMLPRLRPQNFYDLVIEVAIVRPGPIQGGMVHPYLKRRRGLESVVYDHASLEPILKKTLGVPIFQEQVMRIAMVVADFSPGEADQLRKVMSGAWRSRSQMRTLREKLMSRMQSKGLSAAMCERLYRQIEGFGDYGFPESHAASFAYLSYVSAWLKTYHPAEFLCALLNSQPMGFYSARTLIEDAVRHGVTVLPVSAWSSRWDSQLEDNPLRPGCPRVRLGFRLIRGLSEKDLRPVFLRQTSGVFCEEKEIRVSYRRLLEDGLSERTLRRLIDAGAFAEAGSDQRRAQFWSYLRELHEVTFDETSTELLPAPKGERSAWTSIQQDYASVGWSARGHPAKMLRELMLSNLQKPFVKAADLAEQAAGMRVWFLGALSVKQRPPTAGGVVFLTLEDESGFFNLILGPQIYDRYRFMLESHSFFYGRGKLEKSSNDLPVVGPQTLHLKLESLEGIRTSKNEFSLKPRDFH